MHILKPCGLVLLLTSQLAIVSCTKPKPALEAPTSTMKAAEKVVPASECLIANDSAGAIKLGMKVADARKAEATWTFSRTSDGEGVPLIQVNNQKGLVLTLFAGESDVEKPIDEQAKIESIEVWASSCRTAEGVHPGMLLSEIEKVYGKVADIMMTEIESREYATFANQPKSFSFRLHPGANYPEGKSHTTRYNPTTTLLAISIRK